MRCWGGVCVCVCVCVLLTTQPSPYCPHLLPPQPCVFFPVTVLDGRWRVYNTFAVGDPVVFAYVSKKRVQRREHRDQRTENREQATGDARHTPQSLTLL